MGTLIKVFVVDDHRLFLSGVQTELASPPLEFALAGTAGDAQTAVTGILASRPDVVLLDVHLPGGGGRAVIEGVLPAAPETRFLALSVSDAPEDVIAVIRAGARGYVTKSISPADLRVAIHRIHDGDAVFSPRLAGFVLDAFAGHGPEGAVIHDADSELEQLTPREREVLRLIARGYAYKQVAKNLSISIKTVETHVSSVLRKLQLSSRHQLTRWATERKLV